MRRRIGLANNRQCRQVVAAVDSDMVLRDQDLLRLQPKLVSDALDRIDGRAVDVGLAGFAKSPIADRHVKAFEQTFQGRRPAIHR